LFIIQKGEISLVCKKWLNITKHSKRIFLTFISYNISRVFLTCANLHRIMNNKFLVLCIFFSFLCESINAIFFSLLFTWVFCFYLKIDFFSLSSINYSVLVHCRWKLLKKARVTKTKHYIVTFSFKNMSSENMSSEKVFVLIFVMLLLLPLLLIFCDVILILLYGVCVFCDFMFHGVLLFYVWSFVGVLRWSFVSWCNFDCCSKWIRVSIRERKREK
jgi:hypothetical protein